MSSPESQNKDQPKSLLDTHGHIDITLEGDTYTLLEWFELFCPKPLNELDPEAVETKAAKFLSGENPFD